jgi:hypothetical protein
MGTRTASDTKSDDVPTFVRQALERSKSFVKLGWIFEVFTIWA